MNLQELSERVQAMLDGEKKRREVALEFVQKLQNILEPVAPDLWGDGCERCDAVYVWRVRQDNLKREYTDIYFRYGYHYGQTRDESPGFYDGEMSGGLTGADQSRNSVAVNFGMLFRFLSNGFRWWRSSWIRRKRAGMSS